jgi:hypothetical protein
VEFVWPAIGFLSGVVLWMPFIIGARTDAKLARLEGRLRVEVIRATHERRPSVSPERFDKYAR